jgi:DNA-binding transcriptional MocR family regulator
VLRGQRAHLHELVQARLPGWHAPVPPGGLSLWVDLGTPTSSAITLAAERFGLRLAPGPRFGLDGAFEQYLRLPYTLSTGDLTAAFDRLVSAAAAAGLEPTGEPPSGCTV